MTANRIRAFPVRLAIGCAILALSWLAFGGAWRSLFAARPETEFIADEDFPGGAVHPGARVDSSGFFACPDGWCVYQRTSGTLVYRPAPRPTGVLSRVSPWFYMPTAGSNEIAISLDDGRTFVPLVGNASHSGAGFSVPEGLQRAGAPIALRFALDNRGPNQALGLDKLMLVYTNGPVPDLPRATTIIPSFFIAGLAFVCLLKRPDRGVAILLVLTVAAAVRYEALTRAVDRPLDPDARVYRQLAGTMDLFSADRGFYSANFNEREPGFVLAAHAFFEATHDSEYHLRLLTAMLSIALVLTAASLAGTLFGTAAALVVGVLMALNAPLVDESVRGLRLEAESIVWLLWLGLVFVRRVETPLQFAAAGLLGGLLLLVRSSYGPSLVVLIGVAAWTTASAWRARLACAALAIAVMAASVAPHRVSMLHRRGDAFWDTASYARWLANFEFADRPGFPTRASLEQNGYVGPRITYGQYLFGLHTPGELVGGTLRGYLKMVANMKTPLEEIPSIGRLPGPIPGAVLAVGLAGLVAAAFRRRYLWLPVAFVTVLGPAAFLYDRGLLESYRHSYQAFPLLLLAACVPVALVAERLAGPAHQRLEPAEVGSDS